jgi:hypothetical protein
MVYKTTNAGLNWSVEPRVTINPIRRMKAALGYNIIAAGQYGTILKYGLNMTSTGNNNTGVPSKFNLEQNFPNPFNPNTNIKFSIPEHGNVKLTVFDITGRIVTELANGNMNAGNYEMNFDGTGISSGVYFYRLDVTGDAGLSFSETKKMILVK